MGTTDLPSGVTGVNDVLMGGGVTTSAAIIWRDAVSRSGLASSSDVELPNEGAKSNAKSDRSASSCDCVSADCTLEIEDDDPDSF